MEFLTQVTQQLSQADGRENMQAVLEQLSKNGLDALARSENINFPRAVSRMKKVEMISILLDEFVRRLDVASEQKNLANNSGTTELQPEDTTAEKHVCDYNTQCVQSAIQDVQNNVDVQPDTEALPDDFIPVQEVSSLPAVPVVEEYLPANTPKVMHWAFKWRYMHWDDFSQYSDEHLIAAGLFLGLKFSPSISRDEAIKILDERMRLILQQTPDEETAACYCQDVQKPITPVAPQHKTSLSTLLVQANHEVDAPLFTTEEMKALTRQAFMETRKIAEKFTAKTSWRGHMVSVKKYPADQSRQYKIQF